MARARMYENGAAKQRAYRLRKAGIIAPIVPRDRATSRPTARNGAKPTKNSEEVEAKAKAFLRKCEANLTLPRFIDALRLAGVMDELVALGAAGQTYTNFESFQWAFLTDYCDLTIKDILGICTRGGSKTMISGIGIAYIMFKIWGFKWASSSGSMQQADQLYDYLECIFEHFKWCIAIDKRTGRERMNTKKITLANNSSWTRLPSSGTGARAKRADGLAIDESVEMKERILKGYYGQIAASKYAIVRNTTTPHLSGPSSMYLKERWTSPNVTKHTWTWEQCPWITQEYITRMKDSMSHEEFKAEFQGQWGKRTGGTYNMDEIEKALMPYQEILKVKEQYRRTITQHVGIDWGRAHLTVAIKGFLAPYRGAILHGGEALYIYDLLKYSIDENKQMDTVVLPGIVNFCKQDQAKCVSEESPKSSSENDRLEIMLRGFGIALTRQAFNTEKLWDKNIKIDKENFVQALIKRLNQSTIVIASHLTLLIDQLKDSERDPKTGDLAKGNDDAHDALLHLIFSFEKAHKGLGIVF